MNEPTSQTNNLADTGKKTTVTVIFGGKACRYANVFGAKATVKIFNEGRLDEGAYQSYTVDTEHDADILVKAIEEACGWDAVLCEKE